MTVRLDNTSGNRIYSANSINGISTDGVFYGSNGDDFFAVGGVTNTIYGGDGDDHITLRASGNEFYGEAGEDIFELSPLQDAAGTDVIRDYEFGKDVIQVCNSGVIVSSVDVGTDKLLNLFGGGCVKVSGAAGRLSILDSGTGRMLSF